MRCKVRSRRAAKPRQPLPPVLTADKLAAPSFAAFTEAVIKSRYAGLEVSPDMCLLGASAYSDAVKALRLSERIRWYRRRIRAGMGSVKHIP